jgi:cytidylate kinase
MTESGTDKTVITVSRQYGSGGREVGKKLAEKLGIAYYDKELIALAAKESGVGEEFFEKEGEQVVNPFAYLFSYALEGSGASQDALPLSDRIFIAQAKIIKQIATEGDCVIVGRCSDYVLDQDFDSIDVFVHSDRESRVTRVMQRNDLDRTGAIDRIKKTDKRRSTYYQHYTDRRWGDTVNFDLALSTSKIGIDGAVELLGRYVELRKAH